MGMPGDLVLRGGEEARVRVVVSLIRIVYGGERRCRCVELVKRDELPLSIRSTKAKAKATYILMPQIQEPGVMQQPEDP